ncbi:MAG: hypothetical protein ISQ32_04750 [Rickettsiales bacterium]|nr:hypothetical protein [Rickettsiales bacterium]
MFSNKTPKDIYLKLVSFFQTRKANKYRAQFDQDSSDFKEFVKEKIQKSSSNEFNVNGSQESVDIDQELHKLGIPNIDEVDNKSEIPLKLKNFIKNIRKKLKKAYLKSANLHAQAEKDPRSQPNILPVKVIKDDLKKRVEKNQAISSMLAQKIASTSQSREASRKDIQKKLAEKKSGDGDLKKVVSQSKEAEKAAAKEGLRSNDEVKTTDQKDLNKDGKIDNQEKVVVKQNEQRDLNIKFRADAINNIGENPRKSEWVKALTDTAVQGKDGGRSV